jgi:hypothetical protein
VVISFQKVEEIQLRILRKDGDWMNGEVVFDYSKLRGRIVEKFGVLSAFAKAMGFSDGTLSSKLSSKTYFTTEEVVSACEILDIPLEEIQLYFFALKV